MSPSKNSLPSDGFKRSRTDVDDSHLNRPFKQTKLEQHRDKLRDHLPEVQHSEVHTEDSIPDLSRLREEVLEHAKERNTIAFFPRHAAEAIHYDFIQWAVNNIKSEQAFSEKKRKKRAVVFIVEKDASIEAHARYINSKMVGTTCFAYSNTTLRKDACRADILIMTSQRLLETLSQGTLKMKRMHSLVIEDAQIIQNQGCHYFLPVVQAISNFYFTASASSRPRIFALAISSRNWSDQFDSKMLRLELALDSHLYGVTSHRRQEVLDLPDRPNESVVLYDSISQQQAPRSPLYQRLLELDRGMKICGKYFRAADIAASKLGHCASDLVWRSALTELESAIPSWHEDDDPDSPQRVQIRLRDTIRNWTFVMPNLNPSAPGFNVNHKFLRLIQVLESCRNYGEDLRAIIFVQHRSIAHVLAEILRMLNDMLPFIRPIAVSGGLSFYSQRDIFFKFASGMYNLIVATKSVEDLGIPNASVVIRFDLFDGQISHAHARACTRGSESQLVHLVERNSDEQRRILDRSSSHSADVLRWMDSFHRSPRIPFPPRRIRGSLRTYQSDSEEESDAEDERFIVHPITGGRIYLEDATMVLIDVASQLSSDTIQEDHSMFEFQLIPGRKAQPPLFTCSTNLPGTEIDGITGAPAASQHLARRTASFEACKQLLALGLLDYQAVPLPLPLPLIPRLQGQEEPEVRRAIGGRKYLRQQPIFWSNSNTGSVSILYPTVLSVVSEQARYSPLVLLTRQPLPAFPDFNLYLSNARMIVQPSRAAPFRVDAENAKLLRGFTLRVFRSILNKPVDCELQKMSYLLAPLLPTWKVGFPLGFHLQELERSLDWELIEQVQDKWAVPIRTSTLEELEEDLSDAIIQDRSLEFTRRYHVVKVRPDISPLSKSEPSEREAQYDNYLQYVEKNRKEFFGLKNDHQPLVQVDKVLTVFNNLSPRVKDLTPPSKSAAKHLIPELCVKFVLSSSLVRTALLLPSIMWKIDDLLVVKEMNNRFFDNAIREDLLSEAVTAVSAGMEQDYERLELLGDSFLKYISSIFVFVTNPTQNEGSLHISRQKLISNKVLLQASIRANIPPYIRSTLFNTKSWNPPNYVTLTLTAKDKSQAADKGEKEGPSAGRVPPRAAIPDKSEDSLGESEAPPSLDTGKVAPDTVGKTGPEECPKSADDTKKPKQKKSKKAQKEKDEEGISQSLGDKAIADVAEAIAGAAYISGGRDCALRVLKILTLPLLGINSWSDFGSRVIIPHPYNVAQLRPGSMEVVEAIIGHSFRQPHLLAQAMTHTSVRTNGMTSYERLEFIGDAILDFMVIRYIYDRDHALSPGGLTLLKSAMVSNSTLAAICVSSGLQEHLLFESHQLSSSIQEYATTIKQKAKEEYRNVEANGRKPGQFWAGIEPPKALSDVVESIIGAVYISDDFSPVGAEAFFDNVLRPFFDKHITLQTLTHHPTKTLFELIQAHGCQAMKITKDPKSDGVTTCHVIVHEETLSTGSGPTPTSAARMASELALEAIKEDANVLLRICDCRGRARDRNSWMAQGFKHALSSLIEEHSDGPGDGVHTERRAHEGQLDSA